MDRVSVEVVLEPVLKDAGLTEILHDVCGDPDRDGRTDLSRAMVEPGANEEHRDRDDCKRDP